MSDERARPSGLDDADLERRLRALERQALEAQPPAEQGENRVDRLKQAARGRRGEDAPADALLSLLVGVVLMGGSLLLLMGRIVVWSGFGFLGAQPPLALLLVPFILGVALTLAGGRVLRYLGIALAAISVAALVGVSLTILRLFFLPTPLLTVLGMLALMGLGLGLVVRGVRKM